MSISYSTLPLMEGTRLSGSPDTVPNLTRRLLHENHAIETEPRFPGTSRFERLNTSSLPRSDLMSRPTSCSTPSSYQEITLPPILCRQPIKLRDESHANKPGSEWHEPVQQQPQLWPLRTDNVHSSSCIIQAPNSLASSTQSEGQSFHSSDADNLKPTSASNQVRVLSISTPYGMIDMPVNVHRGSKVADKRRARNAVACARLRKRRKEETIEKLEALTIELEGKLERVGRERDHYRALGDRLRAVVFAPELRQYAIHG